MRDILDIEVKSEIKIINDIIEVDEFNSVWKKVFLEDLDIKILGNVKIVRIFISLIFIGIKWLLNKM